MPNESGEWIMRGLDWDDPLRIRTPEELINYIDQVGFLPLFANELPGFSVEDHVYPGSWWTGDPEQDPWVWREIIARSGRVAYGKFFDRKAGFISKEWFPCFANYRRDGYDFDARYDDELASGRSKKIMDLFEDDDGVITELQMQGYIVTRDFRRRRRKKDGVEYGWPIAVYTTPENLWDYETVSSAYKEDPQISYSRIVEQVKKEFTEASDRQLRML